MTYPISTNFGIKRECAPESVQRRLLRIAAELKILKLIVTNRAPIERYRKN